jgi:two-component system, NtrC family, sensor histidine kinase HydH
VNLTVELHLLAGLGAFGLGAGTLLAEPSRARNRLFALLCGTLALWSLGFAVDRSGLIPQIRWHLIFLLGSCFTAPVGLHLCLDLTGRTRPLRGLLAASYATAGALYLSSWTSAYYDRQPAWNYAAMAVLGTVFATALAITVRHGVSRRHGPERNAYRLLLAAAILAVVAGLSDFLPRPDLPVPRFGAAGLLVLLLVVCALVVRHRFLDVHVFVARSLGLLAGAAAAALLLLGVARLTGDAFLPLFAATLAILLIAGPVGRILLSGMRAYIGGPDPLARALIGTSRRLPVARGPDEVWGAIGEALRVLEGEARVTLYLADADESAFRAVYHSGGAIEAPVVPLDAALPRILLDEGAPVTRIVLEERARSGAAARRTPAVEALVRFRAVGSELAIPIARGARLVGWIEIGGGLPERYLKAEVATAFLAVGHQAVASLERIQAEEESKRREALAAVGEMAAGLAHEVRNPLGAIQGAAQVLLSETDPRRAREMLEVIQEETARLGRVVGEFLDYARPSTQRREPVDLADLARGALRSAEAAGQGLKATLRVTDGTPPAAGDPDQLRRAVGNILRNAREAAGPLGSVRIEVAPEGPDRVAIRIEDDGPGISADALPRLFQPFFTTRPGGTGLGLALVHRLVEAHGGEVRVEARPAEGAVFTIVLPAATGADESTHRSANGRIREGAPA